MLDFAAEGEGDVGMDAAFVELVEDDEGVVFEGVVGVEHAGEDAFGDDFDFGVTRNFVFESYSVADGLAGLFV